MTEPSDEQLPSSQVKRPAGVSSDMIGKDTCLRCRRSGIFMEPNGLCDDCEHEGRLEEADAEFERKRAYWRPLYEGEKLAGLVAQYEREEKYDF